MGEWHESSSVFSFSKRKLKVMRRQSESNGKEGIIGKSVSHPSEVVRISSECEDANKAQEDSKCHL